GHLMGLLAAACLLGALSLWSAETIKAFVLRLLGPGMATGLAAEGAVAVAAFLLPTVMMGAVFSHLSTSARAAGISFGRALGINPLGAALAPLVIGVLLLPAVGPKFALLAVAAGYLALSARNTVLAWGTGLAIVAVALLAPRLAFVDVPDGGRIVSY